MSEPETLRQKVLLLVLDKVIFAVLVAGFGFLLNKQLDDVKVANATALEASKSASAASLTRLAAEVQAKRDRDLEEYKAALRAANDTSIENLRAAQELDRDQRKLAMYEDAEKALTMLRASLRSESERQLAKFNSHLQNTETLRNEKRTFIVRQLRDVYWPLKSRLDVDTALWQRRKDMVDPHDSDRRTIARAIDKNIILPNHLAMMTLLLANAGLLASPDESHAPDVKEFRKEFSLYAEHVGMYQALRNAGRWEDAFAHGAPFRKEFIAAVQRRIEALTARFQTLSVGEPSTAKEEPVVMTSSRDEAQ